VLLFVFVSVGISSLNPDRRAVTAFRKAEAPFAHFYVSDYLSLVTVVLAPLSEHRILRVSPAVLSVLDLTVPALHIFLSVCELLSMIV